MTRFNPTWALVGSIVGISALWAAVAYAGVRPSPTAETLSSVAISLAFMLWVEGDARRRRDVPCHDLGFLVGVFLPFSLFWYGYRSRGWLGLLTLCGLLALPTLASALALGLR